MQFKEDENNDIIKILDKYPTLSIIWHKYKSSNLWLKYQQIKQTTDISEFFLCAINSLLPSSIVSCKLLGHMVIILKIGENDPYFRLEENIPFLKDSVLFYFLDYHDNKIYRTIREIIGLLKSKITQCPEHLLIINMSIEYRRRRHANVLIINKTEGTIERFDSNVGGQPKWENEVNFWLAELTDALNYVYLTPMMISPRNLVGWQKMEARIRKNREEEGGYCLIWNILYIYLRLRYDQYDPIQIILDFSKLSPSSLRQIIRTLTSSIIDQC